MVRKQVMRFFGVLFLLVGVLVVLHTLSSEGITGSSVHDEGAGGLALSDVHAIYESGFVSVSFYVRSDRDQVQIAYSFDTLGETVRTGELGAVVKPRNLERQVFRVALKEHLSEDLFVTVSVSDGTSFASERVAVSQGSRGRTFFSRSLASTLGFIALFCFIVVYVVRQHIQQRRVRSLAHNVRNTLKFRQNS